VLQKKGSKQQEELHKMLLFVDQNMVVQEVWNILDMVTYMQQEHKDYNFMLHK
jgi:hypothetical protein